MLTQTHPWSHLAPGPYTFIGFKTATLIDQERSQAGYESNRGFMGTVSDFDCIGSCDHCGTGISGVFWFKGVNVIEFKVGETCAKKCDRPLYDLKVKSVATKRRTEMAAQRKKEKLAREFLLAVEWMNSGYPEIQPHPKGWEGKTLKDQIDWYKTNAGRAKFVEVCKQFGFTA